MNVAMETMGQKLIRLMEEKSKREGKNFTKYRLSKLTGLNEAYVGQLVAGNIKDPRRDTLESLAKALDVPVSVFFGEAGRNAVENIPLTQLVREINARYEEMELIEIPIKGTIPGAYPWVIVQDVKTVKIVKGMVDQKAKDVSKLYALEVTDNSLQNEGIYAGYTVIIEPEREVISGKLYIVQLANQASGRKVTRDGDALILSSSDGNVELRADDAEILGRIILSGRWKEH